MFSLSDMFIKNTSKSDLGSNKYVQFKILHEESFLNDNNNFSQRHFSHGIKLFSLNIFYYWL